MEKLLQAIGERVRIDEAIEEQIISSFTREEIDKNQKILKEDQYANKMFFLDQGIVRSFYYHDDKEVTSWLYSENQFFTSWYSFIGAYKSFEYIEALEKSTVYWITKDDYNDLLSKNPLLEKFGRKLLEEQLAFLEFFYKGFLFMSAKEKYALLTSLFPDVTQKVNLGYIASILGISQETLSRIRSQR